MSTIATASTAAIARGGGPPPGSVPAACFAGTASRPAFAVSAAAAASGWDFNSATDLSNLAVRGLPVAGASPQACRRPCPLAPVASLVGPPGLRGTQYGAARRGRAWLVEP